MRRLLSVDSTSGGAATQAATRRLQRLRELWRLIRRKPTVVVLPLMVFLFLVLVCSMGVFLVARQQENDLRDAAASMAVQAAADLKMQLISMVHPVSSMTAFLNSGLGLNYTQSQQIFTKVAKKLLAEVASPSDNMQLYLDPQGVLSEVYPLNNVTRKNIGVDLLGNATKRNATLTLMRNPDKVTFKGPSLFTAGYLGISAVMPVFISGVEEEFNFSMPVPVSPYCPPDLCWQEATKTKFWGAVGGSWPLQDVLRSYGGALSKLQAAGFRYLLKQPAVNATIPATEGYGGFVLIARSDEDVQDPVEVPMDLNGEHSIQAAPWILCVSPVSGWTSAWALPVYGVIVTVSLLGSLLLSAFMICRASRFEDKELLFTLVPKDVFRKLKERRASNGSSTLVTGAIPAGSTPADVLLDLLADCLLGNLPEPAVVVQLRAVLLGLQDIYSPADVSQELRDAHLDEDVANNLAQLLSGEPQPRAWHGRRASVEVCRTLVTTSLPQTEHLHEAWLEDMGSASQLPGPPTVPGQSVPAALYNCQAKLLDSSVSLGNILPVQAKRMTSPMMSAGRPLESSTRPNLLLLELTCHGGRSTTEGSVIPAPQLPKMTMPRAMHEELTSILGHAYSSWTFDAFALDRASDGHPLSTLGFYLVEKTGLMQHFKLPPTKVARFFQSLETAYIDNPYHSRTHAADVLQTLHVILSQGGFLHSYVDPARHLACILAAASHDVEHVGLTNDFLCSTEDVLALRYNDRSPMENHHLATMFTLLKRPGHDFMVDLGKDTRDLVRKLAIEIVMATDMKQHMTVVSQFKSVHQAKRHTSADLLLPVGASPVASTGPVFIDETERLLSLQMAMKLADLGHLAETPDVHHMWVAALEDEFFQQGDKEREAGIPITPLFDRNKPGITKSQVGFYDFVVMPLFTSFSGVFKKVQPLVDCAAANHRFWKENAAMKNELDRLALDQSWRD